MTLVGSAMIASQINIPGLIVTSNLQHQRNLKPEPVNTTKDCFRFNDDNITCFEDQLMFLKDDWSSSSTLPPASLSSLSLSVSSSWLDSAKPIQDSNDSHNDANDFFLSDMENDIVRNIHGNGNEKSDVMMDVMKMMRVTIEDGKSGSRGLLINYFERSSTSTSVAFGTLSWFSNLFSVSRSSSTSSSSSVKLPTIDVTH